MKHPQPVLVSAQPKHVLKGPKTKKRLVRTVPGGASASWEVPGVPGRHRSRAAAERAAKRAVT